MDIHPHYSLIIIKIHLLIVHGNWMLLQAVHFPIDDAGKRRQLGVSATKKSDDIGGKQHEVMAYNTKAILQSCWDKKNR